VIKRLVRAARINPLGLDWRRFVVAVDPAGAVIGAGQVKPHPDGTRELASIVVRPKWRGRGVARAIIEQLMRESEPPLWLMCRSSLRGLYHRFGFGEVVEAGDMPPNFRRMRRLAGALEFLAQHGEYLAVMVWRARDADREREA
jgi:amino-acid N-acetyltransferase